MSLLQKKKLSIKADPEITERRELRTGIITVQIFKGKHENMATRNGQCRKKEMKLAEIKNIYTI